jgi:hypothetical protein
MTGCTHRKVTTFVFVDGNEPSGLWACADCGHKFAPVNLSMEKDAERYRKLAAAATEQLLHPDRARCEMMPDRRTHWKLPVLMCSGPVGGFVSFADAVDALHNA